MKIKFHEVSYTLEHDINLFDDHFQSTFYKEDKSFDDILNDTLNVSEITVFNDEGETIGVYSGFTNRLAVSIYSNNDIVSVEFERISDVDSRLSDLEDTVDVLAEEILG